MDLLQNFYETTLEALKDAKNDRLWFKTNIKLGKLYFDCNDFVKMSKILKQLHQSCQNHDGTDDMKKGTQLLEIYALEIQMYTAQKNNKKLKVGSNTGQDCLLRPALLETLREIPAHQVGHSTPADHGRDSR